jgi:WD40 repeat protein
VFPVEIVPQVGHSNEVFSVAISPDGKTALSGSRDHTLKLWDLATGREIREFKGHSEEVTSVAISPDGKTALSGSGDSRLKLWDLATGREIRTFQGGTGRVAITPDGKTALSSSNHNTLRLWDLATGDEIREFKGHSGPVYSVAISPDGRAALSGSNDNTLKLWDLATGREIRSFKGHSSEVNSVAFSSDGKTALSGSSDRTVGLWDLATGREIRSFKGHSGSVTSVAISPGGETVLSGSSDETLKLWDLTTGREIRDFKGHSFGVITVAISPNGKTALSGGANSTLKLWDLATGREIREFKGHSGPVHSVAISPDGRTALSGSCERYENGLCVQGAFKLWDLASGREIRAFKGHSEEVGEVAISPDGRAALSASWNTLKLWDLATGREIREFKGHSGPVYSVAISPDGRAALSGSRDNTLKLWDLATGREIREFKGHSSWVTSVAILPDGKTALSGSNDNTLKLWDLATGREIREFKGHSGPVYSVAILPDGRAALSGSRDNTLKLWDLATGREIREFKGHSDGVVEVAISPDGKTALSGSADGSTRLWDLERGEERIALFASPPGGGETPEDGWLAITPKGFFTASRRDTDALAIVRGFEIITIGQVHQSLSNPDLVREALAGDPNGEVARAAEVINLDKVLDAGPPPAVVIASHEPSSRSSKDLVTVAARVTDRGKGIGRIEWRINGVTAGVMSVPTGPGPDYDVSQELALDPGENRIEVIAYEGRNLLASLPAQTTIVYDGPADKVKPKLFVLAIGINKYVDKGGQDGKFPPLDGSVPDAKAFSAEMEKAGAGQYESVRVTLALDENATLNKLNEAVAKIASEISPRDSFVLYAAAHGYSLGGNYYMIPQDYQGGGNPDALKTRAVSQERIQEWLAKRIKAKRAIILLDTCESGALTGGYTKSRTEGPVAEAAVGRLHEATGRPVVTAASPGKSAYENYKGHGVFTYALIEALHKGDTNNNGKIEVSELAAHVERRVPELFAELKQNGFVVKGLAAARGGGGDAQTAHFGSTGEDFSLVARLP